MCQPFPSKPQAKLTLSRRTAILRRRLTWLQWLHRETHGAATLETIALAALVAIFFIALLTVMQKRGHDVIAGRMDTNIDCQISLWRSGSNGDCGPGGLNPGEGNNVNVNNPTPTPTPAPEEEPPAEEEPSDAEACFEGAVTDRVKVLEELIEKIKNDPWGFASALWEVVKEMWEEFREDPIGFLDKQFIQPIRALIDAFKEGDTRTICNMISQLLTDYTPIGRLFRTLDLTDKLGIKKNRLDPPTHNETDIVLWRMADALIGPNGRFLNASLEDAYQAYVKRKLARGEIPRERADWKVERDYWLTESPLARGNRFDNIAGDLNYRYNQVHLANGKRLDSYDPVSGEIISRKATDFDVIQGSSFRTYLREIKAKYSEGTIIRSDKYPDLDGQPLRGQYVLEVPDSNLNAVGRAQFEQAAREEGILIRYTNEATGEITHTMTP